MLGYSFISSLLAVAALSIPHVQASLPDLVVSCGVCLDLNATDLLSDPASWFKSLYLGGKSTFFQASKHFLLT
jgi:hypothetical protein